MAKTTAQLLRGAFPAAWKDGKWQPLDIPIEIDGEPKPNVETPSGGSYWKLGKTLEVNGDQLKWTTWTHAWDKIQKSDWHILKIKGSELEYQTGYMNCFAFWMKADEGTMRALLEDLNDPPR